MSKKRTYDKVKKRLQSLEDQLKQERFRDITYALFKISNAVNTTTNLDELYKSIQSELSPVIDTTNFFIALYNQSKDSVTFPYCVDSVDECYPPVIKISKTESLTAEVIRTGLPLLVTKKEILSQRQKSQRKIPSCTPSEIWLGVPLKIETDIIGVMAVQSYDDNTLYDQTDLEVMVSVADQVAIAIENKKSERMLKDSEEKYRLLAENLKDVVYLMSIPDGAYEYISPAVTELFGYSPDEFYNSHLFIKKILHPNWIEYFEEQWANILSAKMPKTYEYQIIHKSGEERWMNQRNVFILDTEGAPVAIEGIVTDITERKQQEIEREKLLSELQTALAEVKKLSGLLPICCNCKKIRDDSGYWKIIEEYIQEHSEAQFSHSICQECAKELYPDLDSFK